MSYRRVLLVVCGWVALLVPSGSAQTVVAIGGSTKELKRTAHQLRISVDQLRNAREALKQATDLARRSSDVSSLSQLSQHWMRFDRTQAPAAIEDLYSWLATAARSAADDSAYQRFTSSAQALLRSLATIDAARASELWQQWLDPPTPFGEALRKRQEEANARFAKQLASQGSGAGMGPDLASLREAAARGNLGSTGILVNQLSQTGDKAEALRVADQAILDFKQREPTPQTMPGFLSFVRQLSNVDPDRYMTALGTMLSALDRQANPKAGGTISVGDQTIQVTGSEGAVIDMCRSLTGRPDLAMKTLNTIPGLKNKLDRIGGIDNIVGMPRGNQAPVSMKYSVDGSTFTNFNTSPTGSMSSSGPVGATSPPGQDLYTSVRGKLLKDPAFVRQKIAEASQTPDQVDALVMLATRSAMTEPDLASLALEAASKLVPRVDPMQKRAVVFQNLMRAYRTCDGEVDPDVLKQGFALVQQLRAEENANAPNFEAVRVAMAPRIAGMADQLEMTILAELSVENFDGAMRYVRLMPEEIRLQALLRIVQSLGQMY